VVFFLVFVWFVFGFFVFWGVFFLVHRALLLYTASLTSATLLGSEDSSHRNGDLLFPWSFEPFPPGGQGSGAVHLRQDRGWKLYSSLPPDELNSIFVEAAHAAIPLVLRDDDKPFVLFPYPAIRSLPCLRLGSEALTYVVPARSKPYTRLSEILPQFPFPFSCVF